MLKPKWCLFYDNHTMVTCPDVGARFDVERFIARVKACGVDFLIFHARCNQGMAYYDTKVGTRHPSLTYDLFGKLSEACQREGIALSAYFNAGLSHEEGQKRRDWLTVNPEGQIYAGDWDRPFYKKLCFNTGYGDHLVAMVAEVVRNYPVAGLFIDGMGASLSGCIGDECVAEMKQRGLDWRKPEDRMTFGGITVERMMTRISETAQAVRPDLLIYYNNPGPEKQAKYASYLECECLPTHKDWGYESLPVYAHYLRTLGRETVLNMTGRFHIKWGDFGGIRTKASLEYDCVYGLANGMRPNVGGHFHPRGDIEAPVFDLIQSVYNDLQRFNPWLDDAKPRAEIAVVSPYRHPGHIFPLLKSAARILSELKEQFDIVTLYSEWDAYRVLILPDEVLFDTEIAARVKRHLEKGGAVISSNHSGLTDDMGGFALASFWPAVYRGEDPVDPPYFRAAPEFSRNVPDMPLCLYKPGTLLEAAPGAETLGHIVDPYYNKGFDGQRANYYTPPNKVTGKPAISRKGNVTHFSFPLFAAFQELGPLYQRELIANALNAYLPDPMLRTEGLPSFGRAFAMKDKDRLLAVLTAYVPERRGDAAEMIEEAIAVRGVKVAFRLDGMVPKKLYLAPDRRELPFAVRDGYAEAEIPGFAGYAVVALEP